MTRPPTYDYRIGAGYDLPLGSLTNIENIVDANGKTLYPPVAYPNFLPGVPATRFDGLEYERGRPFIEWQWTGNNGNGYLTYTGAEKLRADYFNGNWSGSLTIYTQTDDTGNYALFNAVGTIKKQPDSGANFKAFNRFSIKMTRLRRIP